MAFNRYNKSGGGGGGFRSGGFKSGGFRGGSGGFRDRDSQRTEMHPAVCDNCGKNCEVPFRPTSGKPVFCSSCFESKGGGERRSEGRSFERPSFEDRKMYEAVCSNCGKDCKVPFQPRGDKPIFCSNCFENKDNNITRISTPSQPQFEKQLKDLNDKMDKLLKLLSPDDFQEATKEVAQEATIPAEKPAEVVVKAVKKAKKPKKEEVSAPVESGLNLE